MLTNKRREELENLFKEFSDALFAMGGMEPTFISLEEKGFLLLPDPTHGNNFYGGYVAFANFFAKNTKPELMILVCESTVYEKDEEGKRVYDADRLMMVITSPSGQTDLLMGEIKHANDGTPYVQNYVWVGSKDGHIAHIENSLIKAYDD